MSMNGDDLRHLLAVRSDISRAMTDPRFPPPDRFGGDLRMFVVTTLWVLAVERAPRGSRIPRVCEILHLDNFRFWELIRSDLPRYEHPSLHRDSGGCRGWLPRAERRCGRTPMTMFRVTDPADGTWELHGYCSRHKEEAAAAQAAEQRRREAGLPEPLPNCGGLLPCYLPWDWEKNYRKASSSWELPTVGIRADDWPVLAKVEATTPVPPKLAVVFGGRAADGPTIGEANDSGPAVLRVVDHQPTTS